MQSSGRRLGHRAPVRGGVVRPAPEQGRLKVLPSIPEIL
jgi:hypothetical protein